MKVFCFYVLIDLILPYHLRDRSTHFLLVKNVLFVSKKEKEKKNTKTYFPKVLIVSVTLCIEE